MNHIAREWREIIIANDMLGITFTAQFRIPDLDLRGMQLLNK